MLRALYRIPTPKTVQVTYPNGYRFEFEPMPGPGNDLYLYLSPEEVQHAALHGIKCDAVQVPR